MTSQPPTLPFQHHFFHKILTPKGKQTRQARRNRTASDVETNKASPVSEMNPADFVKHEEEIPKMADSTCPEGLGQTVDH